MDFQTWFETLGIMAEGYTTLSFKINQSDLNNLTPTQLVGCLMRYVSKHSDSEYKFLTCGEHRRGQNEMPHFHFNFAVPVFMKTSNESRRRTAYLDNDEGVKVSNLSCKIGVVKSLGDLENCLKYPWKEKIKVSVPEAFGYLEMPREVRMYMKESAHAMFLASEEQLRRKVRSSERTLTILEAIDKIVGDRQFASYQECKEYVCAEFFRPLELSEYPDMSVFRKALEKVAVKRKIVPFHFFI